MFIYSVAGLFLYPFVGSRSIKIYCFSDRFDFPKFRAPILQHRVFIEPNWRPPTNDTVSFPDIVNFAVTSIESARFVATSARFAGASIYEIRSNICRSRK